MNGVLIAPYEELLELAQALKREKKWDLDIVLGDLYDGAKLAQEYARSGARFIISRGGTYRLIRQLVTVPVVEIRVTIDDLFEQLSDISKRSRHVGVAGFENVIRSHRALARLFDSPIEYIPYEDPAQVRRSLIEAAGRGVDVLLADVVGCKTARDLGMEHRLIRSSKDAIIEAVELAMNISLERYQAAPKMFREPPPKGPRIEQPVLSAKYSFSDIISVSRQMQEVIDQARVFAMLDSPILITGETGTGKELFAHSIHLAGPRRQNPFVIVPCGAMPPELLTSELMGYTDGAFTGARRDGRCGLLEAANGGTLFLDEVEDLPADSQAALLRFLQEGQIRRLGENRLIQLDVRVIAATNQDLAELVKERRFRSDLYYRLHVLPLGIPPLRNRREDILPLARHFVRIYSERMEKQISSIEPEAQEALLSYDYPGNVRELQSLIQRAVAFSVTGKITLKDITIAKEGFGWVPRATTGRDECDSGVRPLKDLEKQMIQEALVACSGNVTLAARMLGISRSTLWRRLKAYSL